MNTELTLLSNSANVKPDYKPFSVNASKKRQSSLRINYANSFNLENQQVLLKPYRYYTDIISVSDNDLTFVYDNEALTLNGYGLQELIEPLQHDRIRSLQVWHRALFREPENCVIESVKRELLFDYQQRLQNNLCASSQEDESLASGSNLIEYQAFGNDRSKSKQIKMRIIFANGLIWLKPFHTITEVILASPQSVSIVYQQDVLMIAGDNLGTLTDLIHDEKILYIQQFNSKQHQLPDDGQAVIHSIQWQKMAAFVNEEIELEPDNNTRILHTNQHYG